MDFKLAFSGLQSPADDLCESFPNCSFKETGTQALLSPSHCLCLSFLSVSAYRAGWGSVLEPEHLELRCARSACLVGSPGIPERFLGKQWWILIHLLERTAGESA